MTERAQPSDSPDEVEADNVDLTTQEEPIPPTSSRDIDPLDSPGRKVSRPSRRTIAREDRRRRSDSKRRRKKIWTSTGGGLVAAMLIAGLAIPSFGGGLGQAGSSEFSTPEQIGTQISISESPIVTSGQTHQGYSDALPTSGPRYEEPGRWGLHDEQQPDEAIVANMAVGGIVFNSGIADPDKYASLRKFVENLSGYPACYVLQPHQAVQEGTIVLSAWGWQHEIVGVDGAAMKQFVDSHRNTGHLFIDEECGAGVLLDKGTNTAK